MKIPPSSQTEWQNTNLSKKSFRNELWVCNLSHLMGKLNNSTFAHLYLSHWLSRRTPARTCMHKEVHTGEDTRFYSCPKQKTAQWKTMPAVRIYVCFWDACFWFCIYFYLHLLLFFISGYTLWNFSFKHLLCRIAWGLPRWRGREPACLQVRSLVGRIPGVGKW